MLLVTWRDNYRTLSVSVSDLAAISSLTLLLEKAEKQFFVSDREGKLSQKAFFKSGFRYWLEPHQTFSDE